MAHMVGQQDVCVCVCGQHLIQKVGGFFLAQWKAGADHSPGPEKVAHGLSVCTLSKVRGLELLGKQDSP